MELNDNDRQRIEQQNPFLHSIYHSAWQRGAEYATIYEREKFIDLINEARIAIIDLMNVANDDEFHTPKAADKGSVFLGKTKLMIMDFEAERTELLNKINQRIEYLTEGVPDERLLGTELEFLNSLKTK